MFQIGVIIATAFQRTELLISRSLKSVLSQTYLPDYIVVVDDNKNENELEIIAARIAKFNYPNIFCIRNFKTKYNSGTGAWNSGIEFLQSKFANLEQSYIAILDDDDEWDTTHLEKCANKITETTKAVFANLVRLHNAFEVKGNVNKENLTIENFLIGNPGVQGSNMFFNAKALLQIDGFDETLKSCTDRDLMIRFLQQNSINDIAFVNDTLVFHYAQSENTVTNNPTTKWVGLDRFYNKYLNLFITDTLEQSLSRAEKLFAYPRRQSILKAFANREKIVLAMPMHNSVSTIRRAVLSVVNQKNVRRKLVLVIGNDNSVDNWQEQIADLISENIIFFDVADGGKSYKVRNAINDFILSDLENVAYIGRLDADDELADDFVISKLEQIIDTHTPDVIFAGNYQRKGNEIVATNLPTHLLFDNNYLLERLQRMSLGDFSAELPSCNTFVKTECLIYYPPKESAEDHWVTIELLLKTDKLKVFVAEDLVYCIYSLNGNVTKSNKVDNTYIQSRKDLYDYYLDIIMEGELSNIKRKWSEYITSEGTSFHINNIHNNKDRLVSYWKLDCPLHKTITNVIKTTSKKNIKLLDVGCGPFPKSGLFLEGYEIKRTLVDAIADSYHLLLKENNISTNNQHIINCHAENLNNQFSRNSFDVIFSKNALDHTYNPIKSIANMIELITIDGTIVLEHFYREGEYTNYFGLHQWNFYVKNDCFYISNKNDTIIQNINDLFPNVRIRATQEQNIVIITITNKNRERKNKALNILQSYKKNDYSYLGEGQEGVVFTDEQRVYKVLDSVSENTLLFLKINIPSLQNAKHLYEIEEIASFQNQNIMIYPYENSEQITELCENDFVGFLAEMWQRKLIAKNIKPENFVRVNEIIKLIDYELELYTDNLFLNMCVRSFIHAKYFGKDKSFINKLCRSAINNFALPELKGVQEFINKVFSTVVFNESKPAFQTLHNVGIRNIHLNDRNWFDFTTPEQNPPITKPFRKTVSLIIKTCPQDYETIYANVKHIVKQLCSPDTFFEKIIAIDTKEKEYTREFTNKGTLQTLMQQVNCLFDEQVIDRIITLPAEEIVNVNKRWFGIATNETHSIKDAPIAPQLYAFEQAKGEYIFQMDSDVMIARKDLSHSFLEDMVSEMEKNGKVVSVGFNICQDSGYKPYFGFEDGGFVPEVRMGLFHKQRLLSLQPLPNTLDKSGKLTLSWHRSMHQKQKETGFYSIRGGDSRSFFIHPQNYRKTNADVWTTILDRVESGYIPECQKNEFDCAGSYYDWTIPKRNEKLVVVCLVRNIEYARFLKMFCSVVSQTYKDWGMIIIDDVSDNGLLVFIDNIIRAYSERITFIKNRVWQGGMANTYKAIHYFVSNPESVIITVDGDDAIIGNTVFENIMKKYEVDNADVVIGGMYQTYRLQAHYRYPVNFINPRENGGNVWQHIRTFKKYLFDSLDISDLKITNTHQSAIKKALSNQWLPECSDYAMMIPIVEMAKNPMSLNSFCYFHERKTTTPKRTAVKEQCVVDILNKKSKNSKSVFKGKKPFLPNLNKIEIDITYDCNLKCVACNRSCTQAPSKECLEFTDIQNFVAESIELGKKWKLINILGGEPTLHHDFEKFVKYILEEYILPYSLNTVLQVVSNGLTAETRNILDRIKDVKNLFIDYNSFKTNNKIEYFSPFNDAPIDDEKFKDADYTKACWVTSYCGIGLNKFGYYGCSVCGGIDRVINKNRGGIKHLKDICTEKFQEQFSKFCPLCGNFKDYDVNHGNFIPCCEKAPLKENIVTKTWIELYKSYNQK